MHVKRAPTRDQDDLDEQIIHDIDASERRRSKLENRVMSTEDFEPSRLLKKVRNASRTSA
jgi:hypothetical protein